MFSFHDYFSTFEFLVWTQLNIFSLLKLQQIASISAPHHPKHIEREITVLYNPQTASLKLSHGRILFCYSLYLIGLGKSEATFF